MDTRARGSAQSFVTRQRSSALHAREAGVIAVGRLEVRNRGGPLSVSPHLAASLCRVNKRITLSITAPPLPLASDSDPFQVPAPASVLSSCDPCGPRPHGVRSGNGGPTRSARTRKHRRRVTPPPPPPPRGFGSARATSLGGDGTLSQGNRVTKQKAQLEDKPSPPHSPPSPTSFRTAPCGIGSSAWPLHSAFFLTAGHGGRRGEERDRPGESHENFPRATDSGRSAKPIAAVARPLPSD
ncbi:unnamed protein product [Lampetra fluviatilis]